VLLSPQFDSLFVKIKNSVYSKYNIVQLFIIVQTLVVSNVLDPRCNQDLVLHKLHCLANDTMIHKSHHKKSFYLIIIIQMTLQ